MAGVIQVGGLATGLDTNKLIDQLVAVEQRPVDLLSQRLSANQTTQSAVSTFTSKLSTLRSAANALSTTDGVLVRAASSSNATVASAAAGAGAQPGTVTLTVTRLARASIAASTVGLPSKTATVAAGAGSFKFQVGAGSVRSVDVDATTTLQDLAGEINDLGAGVTASAVNLGTDASPDWRLTLVTKQTGASQTISVLQDDTSLAIGTSQSGLNAQFTVSGFADSFERESNTFSDVLAGVTFTLKDTGAATVTVQDDADGITKQAKAFANAFNDLVAYVNQQANIEPGKDGSDATVGALAGDSTITSLVDRLHAVVSSAVPGTSGQFVNLSSLGFATQKDGTLAFDEATFRTALATDADAVAALFAGPDGVGGIAGQVVDFADQETSSTGTITIHTNRLTQDASSIQDDIDRGNAAVAAFRQQLETQFTALETLVSSLNQESSFLTQAFKKN